MSGPRIAALIPAHNEVGTIAAVVRGLAPFALQRLLVVDDASDDGTGEAARAAGAEVMRLEPGQGGGKAQAMKAGIRILRGDAFDYYLFLDGDGQHDPADLQNFLDHLEREPKADFLLGSRLLECHKIPRRRWNTNALGTWTLGRIAGVRWEDSQCGFRMVKKKVLDRIELRSNGFAIEMEMAMKAADWNLRWVHVPVQAIYHDTWASHFRGALDTYLIAFASLSC